jgi:hypothetical protein
MTPWWLLPTLLIVPALMAGALGLSWLEIYFAQSLVQREVGVAWASALNPEEIEELIARSVARVIDTRN